MWAAICAALAVWEYTKHVPSWTIFWAVLAAMCLCGYLGNYILVLTGKKPTGCSCNHHCGCDEDDANTTAST